MLRKRLCQNVGTTFFDDLQSCYISFCLRRKRHAMALEYLDRLGLKDWAHHMPNEMSEFFLLFTVRISFGFISNSYSLCGG